MKSAGVFVVLFLIPTAFGSNALARKGSGDQVPGFRQAYLRERALLREELRGLQESLDRLQKENAEKKADLERQISALVNETAARRSSAERMEERARAMRRKLDLEEDDSHVLDSVIEAAGASLRKRGVKLSGERDRGAALSEVFQKGFLLLRKMSSVHEGRGSFFDEQGREVEGRIVFIGGVAALGAGEDRGGVLVRGVDGVYSLVDGSAAGAAQRLLDGETLDLVPVYLQRSGGEGRKAAERQSFMSTLKAGGIIAWIILLLGVFALILALERVITLTAASNRSGKLIREVLSAAEKGDFEGVESLPKRRGALARVLNVLLENREASRERLDELAAEAVLKETPRLERFLSILGAVAAVAPLLGLLGTVSGMISTFRVITEYGTGDPRMLSGGISEALITTEFGLAVAIPVLLIHTLLSRWGERIGEGMQTNALSLINLLKRDETIAHARDREKLIVLKGGGGSRRGGKGTRTGENKEVEKKEKESRVVREV